MRGSGVLENTRVGSNELDGKESTRDGHEHERYDQGDGDIDEIEREPVGRRARSHDKFAVRLIVVVIVTNSFLLNRKTKLSEFGQCDDAYERERDEHGGELDFEETRFGRGLVGDGPEDEHETVDGDEHVEPRGERVHRVHAHAHRIAPEFGRVFEVQVKHARVRKAQGAHVDVGHVDQRFGAKEHARAAVLERSRREDRERENVAHGRCEREHEWVDYVGQSDGLFERRGVLVGRGRRWCC